MLSNTDQYKNVHITNSWFSVNHISYDRSSSFISMIPRYSLYSRQSYSRPKDCGKEDQRGHVCVKLIFCEPTVHPSIGPRINDVPHVRWSSDHSRSAIDGLDLGQDDAKSARRALSRGHGFSAAGRQAGWQRLPERNWGRATGRKPLKRRHRPRHSVNYSLRIISGFCVNNDNSICTCC